jgi:hypothetical protein
LNFTSLKARVAGETGLDTTNDDTTLGIWVNLAYKHVCGLYDWPWLLKQSTIQTVPDITTGTATITAGSTSLTFSVGPTNSVATQYMIQFPTVNDDWYIIASHTAASTSATLNVAFTGSSNLTAGTYKLRKTLYSLPSDLDRVIDIRQTITDQQLTPVEIRAFDKVLPDPSATGSPFHYSVVGMDSSNYWQIALYPTPNAVINLQIRYLYTPADMSGTNTPVLPEKFHDMIVFAALALYGHPYIDDTRVTEAKERGTEMLELMKREAQPWPDKRLSLRPWDRRFAARRPGMLPPDYPYPWWR